MSKRICQKCKSTNVVEVGTYGGTTYYRCETCHHLGEKDEFTEMTVFDRITASREVLAWEFVDAMYNRMLCEYRYYSMLTGDWYETGEEAHAATVERLNEVEN